MILALLLLAPPTEPGVWLDAPPKPGTVVSAPLDVRGETQALEGVLRVELFAVRGDSTTLVTSYTPAVPVGTVRFAFRWDPAATAPGTVTLRVVATTLLRGFSAEAPGLVVPSRVPGRQPRLAAATRAATSRAVAARATRTVASRGAPSLDDSGQAFGVAGPVLPFSPRPPAPPRLPSAPAARVVAFSSDRSGWTSVAAGLLLLLVSAHLHLVLRRDLP